MSGTGVGKRGRYLNQSSTIWRKQNGVATPCKQIWGTTP